MKSSITREMKDSVKIGADLIAKYAGSAPRYTSYPTAPQFHTNFDEDHYIQHTEQSNTDLMPKDLSLYLHIPFCHSLCYFCGCNKMITQKNNAKVGDYLDSLNREIQLRGKHFNNDRLVTQIHFGGGTPNFLNPDQIAEILDQVAAQFHLDIPGKVDMGIELDPRATTPDEIHELAKLGFNRFSIGVQDFSPQVQKAVNREQAEYDTLAAIAAAREVSNTVNVDLITGLPHQTIDSFEETLHKVIATGVTRIAAYNFAYLPQRIKAQKMLDQSALPSAKTRLALTKLTRDVLLDAGYRHVGMDHFALPDDPLSIAQANNCLQRNFQGYTTHKDTDLVGLGVSAISKLDTAYAQNETSLAKYNEMVSDKYIPIAKGLALTGDDRVRAEVIQQIMCRNSIDLSHSISPFMDQNSRLTLLDYFKPEMEKLCGFIDDGLIIRTAKGFDITETGRYFMRPIAGVFDRHLNPFNRGGNVVPMSRTI